jgi:exopolyphosphatase/guanosine-5'-triphosphate,3'-diphosphate pyrophosphatase
LTGFSDLALLAVIDVGTNTLRLLIGSVSEGNVKRVFMDRAVTRLGAGLARTGRLSSKSIVTSIETLAAFKATCEIHGVQNITAFGTSALREAQDSDLFLREVELKTGLRIAVISGDMEAALTVKGVASGMKPSPHPDLCRLIVDIGGGSTEWIFSDGGMLKGSVPVGVVKLSENFPCQDPPSPAELNLLKHVIQNALTPLADAKKAFLSNCSPSGGLPTELILTGGTPTSLAAVDMGLYPYDGEKIHLHQLTLPALEKMLRAFTSLSAGERGRIPGLEPERADLIIAGTVLVVTLMDIAGTEVATVSDHGLLEGALMSFANPSHPVN